MCSNSLINSGLGPEIGHRPILLDPYMARVAIGCHELGSKERGLKFVVSEMKKLKNHKQCLYWVQE